MKGLKVPVNEEPATIEIRLGRIEKAITTLAWWLVEAQTGFNEVDAKGIVDTLAGKR